MRSSLHEKTAIAKEKIRTERNATDEADTTWEKIVELYHNVFILTQIKCHNHCL